MGNGWHEWPLVIFTVLGQCVVLMNPLMIFIKIIKLR
ncbi:DmsC/YnfH family molybdoenzyme membrane anchor subunit [Escherichia coli]|nr:DmsC/YnfH family molybdoenzyme membrane anchor subunit [Escherichia coli]MDF0834487.1 dimethyl sulfoxide reductase anchor subunit [Escherichia coli]